jgi:hypothetical protein
LIDKMSFVAQFVVVAALALGGVAAPTTTISAAPYAGSETADSYPPADSRSLILKHIACTCAFFVEVLILVMQRLPIHPCFPQRA